MTFRYVLWERITEYERVGWMFAFPVSSWGCMMRWPCSCKLAEPVT